MQARARALLQPLHTTFCDTVLGTRIRNAFSYRLQVLRGKSLCVDRAPPDVHGAPRVCGRTCRGKGATRGGALGGDGWRSRCLRWGVEVLVTMDPAVDRADGGTLIVRVDVHRGRLMLS